MKVNEGLALDSHSNKGNRVIMIYYDRKDENKIIELLKTIGIKIEIRNYNK